MIALLFVSAVLGAGAPPPMPVLPTCRFGVRSEVVARKAGLPADVRAAAERAFGPRGLAEAGADFQSGDVERNGVSRHRFIRAYHVAALWFIWFEAGGFGLSRQTIAIGHRQSRKAWEPLPGSRFAENLCAGSRAFLTGARSTG